MNDSDPEGKSLRAFYALCVMVGWVVLVASVERANALAHTHTICPSLNLRIVPLPGDRSLVFCADGGERE